MSLLLLVGMAHLGPSQQQIYVAVALILLGLAIRSGASGQIRKNRVLAVRGLYSVVRHPLYFGSWVCSWGAALATGRIWLIPVVAILFVVVYNGVMDQEEKVLYKLFRADEVDHFLATRNRWIPRWNGCSELPVQWSLHRLLIEHMEWQAWVGLALYGLLVWCRMNYSF